MISRILKLIITIEIVMCVRGKNTSALGKLAKGSLFVSGD
jgi:hypothetical protein